MILSPFCLSKLRNLSSPLIITELINSDSCSTDELTFSIIFSNPPSESFTEEPKVVLYSNKNGYVNSTCETTIIDSSLKCSFDGAIKSEDDFYFVNMTIPEYTYISNIPSTSIIRKSNTIIEPEALSSAPIYLSEPYTININTTEIYYKEEDNYIKIPCSSKNDAEIECVLSQQFDLSTLKDNQIQLYYRNQCALFKDLGTPLSVYSVKLPETVYVNINEDKTTKHDLLIDVSTKTLEGITLINTKNSSEANINCEKTTTDTLFKCSFSLKDLGEEESTYTISMTFGEEKYEPTTIVVSLYDQKKIEIISSDRQIYQNTSPTSDPLIFKFLFTQDIGTEIVDEPGYAVRDVKMESNSLKSHCEPCTIEVKTVSCTYYSPENATVTFSYKNSIGDYQKLGTVTIGNGSPIYYESSVNNKINKLLFVLVSLFFL